MEDLCKEVKSTYNAPDLDLHNIEEGEYHDRSQIINNLNSHTSDLFQKRFRDALGQIASKEEELKGINHVHRNILLLTLDQLWRNHLHTLDYVKKGVALRAYAQKDPLNEYKFEAFRAFESMMDDLSTMSIQRIFHVSRASPEDIQKIQNNRKMAMGGARAAAGAAILSNKRTPRLKSVEKIVPRTTPEDRDPKKTRVMGESI